jgi:hypothetical protein
VCKGKTREEIVFVNNTAKEREHAFADGMNGVAIRL